MDLTGAVVTATLSLVQFETEIQPASGTKYDVHMNVKDDKAVYDVDVDIIHSSISS